MQSRGGSCDFADGFPVIRPGTARLPRRFAPRNDTSGGYCGAPAPSSGLIPLCKALNERRYRRNRSVRFYRHLVRTGSAFPRLPRRFAPRNDTSGEREVHQCPPTVELLPTGRSLSAATGPVGAVTILTAACANRLCSAGRGMPLPYKARPESCLLFILHFSVFSIHFFTYAPPATACACFA